jgi:hypothetical protein
MQLIGVRGQVSPAGTEVRSGLIRDMLMSKEALERRVSYRKGRTVGMIPSSHALI